MTPTAFSRGEKMWFVDRGWLTAFAYCMTRNERIETMSRMAVLDMCIRNAGEDQWLDQEEVSGEPKRGTPTDVREGDAVEASPAPENSTPVNISPGTVQHGREYGEVV